MGRRCTRLATSHGPPDPVLQTAAGSASDVQSLAAAEPTIFFGRGANNHRKRRKRLKWRGTKKSSRGCCRSKSARVASAQPPIIHLYLKKPPIAHRGDDGSCRAVASKKKKIFGMRFVNQSSDQSEKRGAGRLSVNFLFRPISLMRG